MTAKTISTMEALVTDGLSDAKRRTALSEMGADSATIDEVIANSAGDFWWPGDAIENPSLPLRDDPLIEAWSAYAAEAEASSTLTTLKAKLVQLSFPIRAGISTEETYRAATLKGQIPDGGEPLSLDDPDGLSLMLHPSLAGTIPILAVRNRTDFETIVRALTARNEPVPIPDSMGACLINGLNNWDRIKTLKSRWEGSDASKVYGSSWSEEFRRIIPQTSLYKDRLIVLSHGPYSGVEGKHVGIEDGDWERLSFDIRLEHECVHALSLKLFGAMRHDLFEELIADWLALVKVFGEYRADFALRFLGLETFSDFREGGRLEVYRGTPPVSDRAFKVMQSLATKTIRTLDTITADGSFDLKNDAVLGRLTVSLLTMPIEELIVDEGFERVRARYDGLEEVLAGS